MSNKVCIIAHPSRTGGGLVIALNLLKQLKLVSQTEQFLVVCSEGYGYEEIDLPPNSDLYVYKGPHSPHRRMWFERVTLPKIVARYAPDVILGLGNIGLTRPSAPQAMFIQQGYLFYDRKHYPGQSLYHRLRIASLKAQVKKSLPGTDLIFAQTPVVRKRIAQEFQYPQEQIEILRFPPPAEITVAPDSKPPAVIQKHPDSFFILVLTRYLAHRNPGLLIPLCLQYKDQLRQKNIKFITTLDSGQDALSDKFLDDIVKLSLEDIIINVGRLSRENVAIYLDHCNVFWLPTLMECLATGYLEAMSIGIPILAPDLDFARYTCEAAALYYDPWRMENIFEQIMSLRENKSISANLIAKGRACLADTSKYAQDWNEVTNQILTALRKLANK